MHLLYSLKFTHKVKPKTNQPDAAELEKCKPSDVKNSLDKGLELSFLLVSLADYYRSSWHNEKVIKQNNTHVYINIPQELRNTLTSSCLQKPKKCYMV